MITAMIQREKMAISIHDDFYNETSKTAAKKIMEEVGRIISAAYHRNQSSGEAIESAE